MEILIADSGSTKCEWCYISGGRKQVIETQGASPYFLNESQLIAMMQRELLPPMKGKVPKHIFFYGTGQWQQLTGRWLKGPSKNFSRRGH
jgi:hypothetical protein